MSTTIAPATAVSTAPPATASNAAPAANSAAQTGAQGASAAAPPKDTYNASEEVSGDGGGGGGPTSESGGAGAVQSIISQYQQDVGNPSAEVGDNKNVTQSYHDISHDFDVVQGGDGYGGAGTGPAAGANWATQAQWASKTAGDVIDGHGIDERFVNDPKATENDTARGNLQVYQDLGPKFQSYIDTFSKNPQASFGDWAKSQGLQGQELSGFQDYNSARTATDAKEKQQYTLKGNLEIGSFEQHQLDPFIKQAASHGGPNIPGGSIVGDVFGGLGTSGVGPFHNQTSFLPAFEGPDGNQSLDQDVPGSVPDNLKVKNGGEAVPGLKNLLDGFRHGNEDTTSHSASSQWTSFGDRMNYIATLFQADQMNPDLFNQPLT